MYTGEKKRKTLSRVLSKKVERLKGDLKRGETFTASERIHWPCFTACSSSRTSTFLGRRNNGCKTAKHAIKRDGLSAL